MKRVDQTVINDMLDKGILVPGKYLVIENYLTVTADLHDKVSAYLRDHGFWPTGTGLFYEDEAQQWTFWINRG